MQKWLNQRLLWGQLLLLTIHVLDVAAMMDFRHFADDATRPVLAGFSDPGIRPPSFVYDSDQLYPPYTLVSDVLEPFPGCDAQYASICAIQHSIRLVTQAREEACPSIEVGGTLRSEMLANITAGLFTAEGSTGFGVFVVSTTGEILADSIWPSLVGSRFDGVLASGMVVQNGLLGYLDWVVRWGGGFVPHFSTRTAPNGVNVMAGEGPIKSTGYFEACATGERIGVAFARTPLPSNANCDDTTNDFCALQNVRKLAGLALTDALNAHTEEEMEDLWYRVSFSEDFTSGNFYTLAYMLSWWGYPGASPYRNPGPLDDNSATCLGTGGNLIQYAAGWNLTNWVTGELGGLNAGTYLHAFLGKGGWQGGAWQDYTWYSASLGVHQKIAFGAAYVWNGTAIGLGAGLVHSPAKAALGPLCQACLANRSLPCSVMNALRLASHGTTEYLTPTGDWNRISNDMWFGSMHDDAITTYAGTWPSGFYIFALDLNGTIVADGSLASNVGQESTAIFSDQASHDRLSKAASVGGAWVNYTTVSGEPRLARVSKLAKAGRFYYLAASFSLSWAPWVEDCTSSFSEPCSEYNTEALIGHAAGDLLQQETESALEAKIVEIANMSGEYSSDARGDFRVYALTEEFECESDIDCPDWPEYWLTSISHAATYEDPGWISLSSSGNFEEHNAFVMKIDWSSPTTVNTRSIILVSFVNAATGPPRCSSSADCTSNAECSSAGRCECSSGYRVNYTLDTESCATLPPSSMECVDVQNMLCNGLVCQECPAGYQCSEGEAVACGAGFVCSGGNSVRLCPKGTVGNQSKATSFEFCKECPAGTYNAVEGETSCQSCAAGTHTNETGQSECERCPVGSYQENIGSLTCVACDSWLTTSYRAATSVEDCVCPGGTFQPKGSRYCQQCPDGMDCSTDNTTVAAIPTDGTFTSEWPFPVTEEGYMTIADEPLQPYLCKESKWCPGGGPGYCATNRDSSIVGCSKCLDGYFSSDDGSCEPCGESNATLFVILCIIGMIVGMAIFAHMVNRNQIGQSSAMLVVVIGLGLTVSAVQTLSIFSSMSVKWPEPVKSLLKAVELFSFDISLLRTECLMGSNSVQNLALRVFVAPWAATYIGLVVFLKKKFRVPDLDFVVQTMNAVGACFQLFFVAIFVTCLTPFVCYEHPNNLGFSMNSEPGVLCNNTGDHLSMEIVSSLAVLLVIIPYLCMTSYATVTYRSAMENASTSGRHLHMFRFLFFRYHPHAYWYGSLTLLRSSLICLVPVVFRGAAALQTVSMSCILLSFCALQMWWKPWRGLMANMIDSATCILMSLLIVCVAMATDFDGDEDLLGNLAACVFGCVFAVVVTAVGIACYWRLRPRPYFPRYLCYHKAEAAAQARYLHHLIVLHTHQLCFLDSDHMVMLEELLDIVRCRTGTLIVYLTCDTLRRPWCASEVTMARMVKLPVVSIYHPSFTTPDMEDISAEQIPIFLSNAADFKLVEYGITDDLIAASYKWLLYESPNKTYIHRAQVGRVRFQAAVEFVVKSSGRRSSRSSLTLAATPARKSQSNFKPQSLVISSHFGDDEATAVAALISGQLGSRALSSIQGDILMLADLEDPYSDEVLMALCSAHCLVVVLTAGSISSTKQLQVIVDAVDNKVPCIPVYTPNFRLPGPVFFEEDLIKRFGSKAEEIAARLKLFFLTPGAPFSNFGSQQVIEMQIDSLANRLPKSASKKAFGPSKSEINLANVELATTLAAPSTCASNNSSIFFRSENRHGTTTTTMTTTTSTHQAAKGQPPGLDVYCGEILC